MTLAANASARLASLLGSERVVSSQTDLQKYAISGQVPGGAIRPANAEEVAEIIRFAAAENLALVCCGSRTKAEIGMPPRRYDFALDLSNLAEIAHYDPEDLTLSVDAGLSLGALEKVLAAKNQFLPLSVPCFQTSTVGGTIASGVDSMLRLLYGTARDFLIGAEFVDGKGQLCRSGGRVVKNVTGYDIHKLLIGSLGTLAVITRLNFRTFPRPESRAGFLAGFATPEAALSFRKSLLSSGLPFSGVELFDPRFAILLSGVLSGTSTSASELLNHSRWIVYAAFGGQETVVRRIQRDSQDRASKAYAVVSGILDQRSNEIFSDALREAFIWLKQSAADVAILRLVQLQFTPADFQEFHKVKWRSSQEPALLLSGCGTCLLAFSCEGDNEGEREALERHISELLSRTSYKASNATLLHAPARLKGCCGVWGPVPPGFPLMQSVKSAFDPQNIFSSGRFVGGL